jgi:hypothetical protein
MRRSLARGGIVGLAILALVAACSKAEKNAAQEAEPAASATAAAPAQPPAPQTPPVFAPTAPPPAPVVIVPPEESATITPQQVSPAPTAAPHSRPSSPPKAVPPSLDSKPAAKPKAPAKGDDDGLHATPAPSLGVKKVAVLANNHYTCSSTEKRDNVAAIAEPRGARIAIVGQGPCPGEVHDWSAQVTQQRVEVHGTHGAASKCRCVGSGELVLRGLEPGTYDIAVNGGFDRPIATRITVLQ